MWQVFKSTLENIIEQFVRKVKNFDSWKKESWIRPLNAKVRDKIHKNVGYGENSAEIVTMLLLGSIKKYVSHAGCA